MKGTLTLEGGISSPIPSPFTYRFYAGLVYARGDLAMKATKSEFAYFFSPWNLRAAPLLPPPPRLWLGGASQSRLLTFLHFRQQQPAKRAQAFSHGKPTPTEVESRIQAIFAQYGSAFLMIKTGYSRRWGTSAAPLDRLRCFPTTTETGPCLYH